MTKPEMISKLREAVGGLTRAQAESALDALVAIIGNEIVESGNCRIQNLGTFTVKTRAARNGVNPRSGEPIQIPEKKALSFKAASSLVDRLK